MPSILSFSLTRESQADHRKTVLHTVCIMRFLLIIIYSCRISSLFVSYYHGQFVYSNKNEFNFSYVKLNK